ncbi:L-histidine N(alpha)-methyltransferase [Noviherbaspirillum sp. UKPF54]|nr:L-histidine N(alpha)-methyltransferase [Noviherbaspirillum sp. UKPF54]
MPPSPNPDASRDFIQIYRSDPQAVHAELHAGLLAEQPAVSPKYLYDALGSKLFEAICELPEYYPTRTEAAIVECHLADIARAAGQGVTLIDLGAGNCAKAARLFPALRPVQYVPVDISVDFLRDAVCRLRQQSPHIRMIGVGMDFSASLELPDAVGQERRLFFYPGSSIGNFPPEQAAALLRRVREACGPDGGLLIGVDLLKDRQTLDAAYDDALGVTASFNLNLLLHLNRLIGADFDLRNWRHRGCFNEAHGRIEMHLEARRETRVSWRGGARRFLAGERIHTESSYKYARHDFLQLLERSGFGRIQTWTDERGWFMVCHARVR